MNNKVLLVDDESAALAAYERNLRNQFQITTAISGEAGLEAIAKQGPFAVIVSDLRMPGMDGIEFLTRARRIAPESVLMILTGNADLTTAFDAVNAGIYFRFLLKPCPVNNIVKAIRAGIAQYELLITEREILEKTVTGCVEVLTEILGMASPSAFSRATRIKHYVRDIATYMKLPNLWQLEVAAMLSQIGCIAVPPGVLEKAYAGEHLTEDENSLFMSHPEVGGRLISNIPRLEAIARMVEDQQRPFNSYSTLPSVMEEREIIVGAQLLKVVIDLDQLITGGMSPSIALAELRGHPDQYNPEMVKALSEAKGTTASLLA